MGVSGEVNTLRNSLSPIFFKKTNTVKRERLREITLTHFFKKNKHGKRERPMKSHLSAF